MKEYTRSKNAILNIVFGYVALIGIKIIALISRRIFLQHLSIDYLGISGLYDNIIVILSLPEFGIDTAFMYLLYEPIANQNKEKIASLYQWFKKRYILLTIFVFAFGLLFIPFIRFFVTNNFLIKDLIGYYILSLLSLVTSYIMAPKVILLSAYQEQRYHKAIAFISALFLHITQIIVIKIWGNFHLYLLVVIISNIISIILLKLLCSKIHKEIYADANRIEIDKKSIITKTKEAFIYRTVTIFANGIDSILISSIVGTIALGTYLNYYVIICSVQEFVAIITASLISGVGNLMNENNIKKQNEIFDITNMFYHLIGTLGLCGFGLLINQFISFWLGKDLLFDSLTVFMIAFNFYLTSVMSPIVIFTEANGLFKNVKNLLIAQAMICIILSFVFGRMWGVCGIFAAKIISTILTIYWREPKILFNRVLKKPLSHYWKAQSKYGIISIVSFIVCCIISSIIVSRSLIGFITKVLFIVCFVCLLFYLVTKNTKENKRIINLLKNRIL